MVIDLTPEQEALVLETAAHEGKSVGELLTDTLQWFVYKQQADLESIGRGIEQADRGEFISHEEVGRRVARMLQHK